MVAVGVLFIVGMVYGKQIMGLATGAEGLSAGRDEGDDVVHNSNDAAQAACVGGKYYMGKLETSDFEQCTTPTSAVRDTDCSWLYPPHDDEAYEIYDEVWGSGQLTNDSDRCDEYGNTKWGPIPGIEVSQKCMCKNTPNNAWSKRMRTCLMVSLNGLTPDDEGYTTDKTDAHICCVGFINDDDLPWYDSEPGWGQWLKIEWALAKCALSG